MTGAAASIMLGVAGGGSFAVALSPASVSAYGSSGATANLTTGAAIATPSGGISPYSYAWVQTGTSPYTWVINSPAVASTTFTCNSLDAGTTATATFKVTVTDALGNRATKTVSAFANNGQPYDSSGGFGSLPLGGGGDTA